MDNKTDFHEVILYRTQQCLQCCLTTKFLYLPPTFHFSVTLAW